jgi:hypothetical protein
MPERPALIPLPRPESTSTFGLAGVRRLEASSATHRTTKEVAHVKLIDNDMRTATGLPGAAKRTLVSSARVRRLSAPVWTVQGTALPFAGSSASAPVAPVAAHAGARSTDLPGSPPRGAPV